MIKLFTDGGSRGNPGEAGIGVVILNLQGETLKEFGKHIGVGTNNEAEYTALVEGLKKAKEYGDRVICHLDSELVVKQLNGQYKVKDVKMKKLYDEVQVMKMGFKEISFVHIRRELNKEADRLVNEALDKMSSKS